MNPLESAISHALQLRSLAPSPRVNATLSQLVEAVTRHKLDQPLDVSTDEMIRIRATASASETELELYWARRIASAISPADEMALFPYGANYRDLTAREIALTRQSGATFNATVSALIIGSGPLPLTALELHRQIGAHVDCVDISAEATSRARNLSHVLDVPLRHYRGDGATIKLSKYYDVVVIAALAGDDQACKQAILDNISPYVAPGGRIIIRSAHGARVLLYPELDPDVFTGVRLLHAHHPTDHIVNSILIYERAI